jgi:hypothetical protein
MDQVPTNSPILRELEQVLTGSLRCLEIAREERERAEATLHTFRGETEDLQQRSEQRASLEQAVRFTPEEISGLRMAPTPAPKNDQNCLRMFRALREESRKLVGQSSDAIARALALVEQANRLKSAMSRLPFRPERPQLGAPSL